MMCKKLIALIFAIVLCFSLAISCGGGGDDDDDDQTEDDDVADDDVADDDVADDDVGDDDISGDLTADNVTYGVCLDDAEAKDLWDARTDPTNVVQVTWEDGLLKIDDLFAYVNCCAKLAVDVAASGNTVTVTESDIGVLCDCVCPIDFHYEINGITSNQITLVVKRDDPDTSGTFTVAELDLDLGDSDKTWFIPFVEVFAANGGTSAQDPVILRYAACDLYNGEDQQFSVRENDDEFFVYGYDWKFLDNPGTPDPGCQIPVSIDLGTLSSGSYFFGTPNYHDSAWSLMTADLDIP